MPKFSKQHYNAIAYDIRQELEGTMAARELFSESPARRAIDSKIEGVVHVALRFAKRFKEDNEGFDPIMFLDACSPNSYLYPLSELWAEEGGKNG